MSDFATARLLQVAPDGLMPRRMAFMIAVFAATALGLALMSQYLGGLVPCEMCVWQRWPWVVAGCAAMVAALARTPDRVAEAAMVAVGVGFAVGIGLSGYHVGLEQGWWAASAGCGGGGTAATLDDLRRQVMAAPVVRCTDVPFHVLGLSLAGMNVLASTAGLGVAVWTLGAFNRGRARRSR